MKLLALACTVAAPTIRIRAVAKLKTRKSAFSSVIILMLTSCVFIAGSASQAAQTVPALSGSDVKGILRHNVARLRIAIVDGLDLRRDPFSGVDLSDLTGRPAPSKESEKMPAHAPAGGSATSYVPVGQIKVGAIGNTGAVRNRPTKPVLIDTPNPILLKSIQTYHWNAGRGSRPGTISIRGSDGRDYGPWQASGRSGQGGVPNAYWYVEPEVVLEPGKYEIIDSNPSTWATNAAAKDKGFVVIKYQEVRVGSPPRTAEPAMQGQAAQPIRGKRYANPIIAEFRLDWCLKDQRSCGKPAADAFCKFWGMKEAASFTKAEGVGKHEATREILDGAFCEKPTCDGFSEIICR